MPELSLYSPVSSLSGIGPTNMKKLEKLGIRTLYDLLSYFPRSYEDRTKIRNVCDMEVGVPACFRAMVISYPKTSHIRKGLDITKVTVSDMTSRLNLVFFNQPYVKDQLKYGAEFVFYGTLKEGFGTQLQNPEFEPISSAGRTTGRILPVYPLTAGLSNKVLVRCIGQALDACASTMPEILPGTIREKYQLADAPFAYRMIHAPRSYQELELAKRRLIFDEFFIFSAGLSIMRGKRSIERIPPWENTDITPFINHLPYSLTGAQKRVIDTIAQDVSSGVPMNRLVQGDVGSGKTAVAAAAACMACANGKQTALMVPTEILAEQHYASLTAMLSPLDIEVVLLTGSLTAREKRWVKERIASGQAQVVIGTHALLTNDFSFRELGLIITDEQHRFGVGQRAALAERSRHPHMLFLSATPIPRTLSLIMYGDLDVSVIDEMPAGRKPVETFLVGEDKRERINGFIRKHVDAGNQVYVICPAVEENEDSDLRSAEGWAGELQTVCFPDLRVGLVHGKMKPAEKDRVMRAFSANELQILVATTVIEVGVDVPNTTLIVIEDADRFGLSQLHQLRGRVGRGQDQSYCILVSGSQKPETRTRLKALCATTDGFRIAEQDLALRGPGDFFGNRQHGLPQFKVADLEMDLKTLREAQEATSILSCDQLQMDPAYRPLLQRIRALFDENASMFN